MGNQNALPQGTPKTDDDYFQIKIMVRRVELPTSVYHRKVVVRYDDPKNTSSEWDTALSQILPNEFIVNIRFPNGYDDISREMVVAAFGLIQKYETMLQKMGRIMVSNLPMARFSDIKVVRFFLGGVTRRFGIRFGEAGCYNEQDPDAVDDLELLYEWCSGNRNPGLRQYLLHFYLQHKEALDKYNHYKLS